MYEKRLKEISKTIGEDSLKKFYILSHSEREAYFQNNKKAIEFLKVKFNPLLKDPSSKQSETKKNFAYFLIKRGVLQPFLKKIKLSNKLGDVIFAAGQIKTFDLDNGFVFSFPLGKRYEKEFVLSKKIQRKFSKEGFAPKIFELNEDIPYSKEEMLENYKGGDDISVFRKLLLFYGKRGTRKVLLKKIVKDLRKRVEKKGIKNPDLDKVLDKISEKEGEIILTETHGDFARGQVLLKGNSYVFIDWYPRKKIAKENIIVGDLVKFFGKRINLTKDKKFKSILKLYPKEVQKNIELYILLNEINLIIMRGSVHSISLKRIRLFSKSL